jgi:hypothetical protein
MKRIIVSLAPVVLLFALTSAPAFAQAAGNQVAGNRNQNPLQNPGAVNRRLPDHYANTTTEQVGFEQPTFWSTPTSTSMRDY